MTASVAEVKAGLSHIKHIIAIGSGKGGVGKSTVATNLAIALKLKGYKVGLLDADVYGPSQPGLLGHNTPPTAKDGAIVPLEKDGLKFISMGVMNPGGGPIVLRTPLVIRALQQFLSSVLWGELDFLLIDLPPGTGDIQLTLAQQTRLSGAVIVTTPQRVASDVAKLGLKMFENVHVPILGIVENMSGFECPHCQKTTEVFRQGGGRTLASELNVPFLGGIPLSPEIMMSGDEGAPFVEAAPKSHGAQSMNLITDHLLLELERLTEATDGAEPKSMRIFEDNGELEIEWNDGKVMQFQPMKLRLACPCAGCIDEMTGKKSLDPNTVPVSIRVAEARMVGRYGLAITFSDKHSTGIYNFKYLQTLNSSSRSSQEMSV